MQVSGVGEEHPVPAPRRSEPLPPRKTGTIPVTVRLDPNRYDRLRTLVRRLSTTGQHIIQTALDRSMVTLERERLPKAEIEGQSSFFAASVATDSPQKAVQDSFPFVRPEPTVSLTYRASVPMHRWLHRRSAQTGQTIQEIINDALKTVRGSD
ncbi:MAG: hypothetical protein ACRYG8_38115 [Janthinobacterium lividum]